MTSKSFKEQFKIGDKVKLDVFQKPDNHVRITAIGKHAFIGYALHCKDELIFYMDREWKLFKKTKNK